MADEEDDGGGGFRLMFVTLSLILLAFFILLNSMSSISEEKTRLALGSLLGSFGFLPGSSSVDQDDRAVASSRNIAPNVGAMHIFKQTKKQIQKLMSGMPEFKQKQISVTFDSTTGDVTVIIEDEFLFAPGTAVISPRLFPLLGDLGRLAMKAGSSVEVTGHTDSRGKTRDNWELSLTRGAVVARHIEDAANIPKGRICAAGSAHFRPGANTNGKKFVNRRVEILVKTQKQGK